MFFARYFRNMAAENKSEQKVEGNYGSGIIVNDYYLRKLNVVDFDGLVV